MYCTIYVKLSPFLCCSINSSVKHFHIYYKNNYIYPQIRISEDRLVFIFVFLHILVSSVFIPTTLQAGRPRVRFPMGKLELFFHLMLPATLSHYGPRVDLAPNRNEYQQFLGG